MKIGSVVSASVLKGIDAKLELENPEELKVGYPVIVEGKKYDFYCVVKDIYNPPVDIVERIAGSGLHDAVPLSGHNPNAVFSKMSLKVIQIIDKNGRLFEPETIPSYLSTVRTAEKGDVDKIYTKNEHTMDVGTLRGVPEFEIPLNYEKLTEKPFAIFGRTGMGKSILCKIVCNSILTKNVSSVFIFDMHSEYGTFSKTDNTPGLNFFFPEKVEMFTLDPGNREAKPFIIDSKNIRPEDIIIAFQDLSSPMIDALYIINRKRKNDLISEIKNATIEKYPNVHPSALQALQRRIMRLNRFGFVMEGNDTFNQMITLIKNGKSIVLDFGKYGRDAMSYLFIANIIARRLYNEYSEKDYPRLVLFLEEAHKFLAPGIAGYTIFDRLARETRKFNLILALIDQRPSRIDEEVGSQLANRLILSMKEPSDVESALAGVPDKTLWKDIVVSVPARTLLLLGDAIRVPTVVDIMDYNKMRTSLNKFNKKDIDEIAKHSGKIFG
jgi:hypothetical protein